MASKLSFTSSSTTLNPLEAFHSFRSEIVKTYECIRIVRRQTEVAE
jgi:hypothetical protein